MKNSEQLLTRYLLGELAESERATLERRYFEDPRLFKAVTRVEAQLLDDYARGRLAPETLRRFEAHYLAHPERRARAEFARALAARLDRPRTTGPRTAHAFPTGAWFAGLRPGLAAAIAGLVIVAGFAWYALDSRRSGREATPGPQAGGAPPGPISPPAGPTVTLALAVDPDIRGGGGEPTTFVIPPGTAEVRFELGLREQDYPAYRVALRRVGGAGLPASGELNPTASPSGPVIVLSLPAGRFETGDYLLTLQGRTGDGAFEDLSQSLLRIDKP